MFRFFKRMSRPTWFDDIDSYRQSYVDKEHDYNMMLSKNHQLSLNSNQTGINCNVLLISDNSHKIEDFFLANMLQANCSYVVLDDSSETFRKQTQEFFNHKCYIMKDFGYLNSGSKFCYNPFAHIETVDEIKQMVDYIFEHIGYGISDRFYLDTMRLLFHISALYVFESREYSNPTLLDVVNVMQEFKTGMIDSKMLALENKHLNCKAVHFYKVVKDFKRTELEHIVDGFNGSKITKILKTPEVREMLSKDTLNLKGLSTNKQILYIKMGDLDFLASTLVSHAVKETRKNNDREEANRHVQFIIANPYPDGGDDVFVNLIASHYDEKRKSEYSFLAKISNMDGINKALAKTHVFDTIIYRDGARTESENLLSFLELKSDGLLTKAEILNFPNKDALIFIRGLRPIKDDAYELSSHVYYSALGRR